MGAPGASGGVDSSFAAPNAFGKSEESMPSDAAVSQAPADAEPNRRTASLRVIIATPLSRLKDGSGDLKHTDETQPGSEALVCVCQKFGSSTEVGLYVERSSSQCGRFERRIGSSPMGQSASAKGEYTAGRQASSCSPPPSQFPACRRCTP